MKDLKQVISECYGKDLEQRRRWYSPAATAYNQVRPRYPKELVEQLLNTYSPHLKLDPQVKDALFAELRRVINQEFDD